MTLTEARRNGVKKVRLAKWLPGTYLTILAGDDIDPDSRGYVYVIPAVEAMEIHDSGMAADRRDDWEPAETL